MTGFDRHVVVQRVRRRALDRLVVLRERPVGELLAAEQARDALLGHDEGARGVGRRRPTVVRHVADPLSPVPGDAGAARVPRPPLRVGRGAVVEHAAIGRPTERPVVVHPEAAGVVSAAALHLVARLGVAPGVDPVAGARRPVVGQLAERREQPPRAQVVAVDLLRQLDHRRLARIQVVPRQVLDGIVPGAALRLVELLHAPEELRQDPGIGPDADRRVDRLLLPLRPAPAVGERAVALDPVGGRQIEHLGVDLGRVHARRLPELGRVEHEGVDDHLPLQLRHRIEQAGHVRAGEQRIEPEGDEPFESPLVRLVPDAQPRGVAVLLGQVVVGEVGCRAWRARRTTPSSARRRTSGSCPSS